MQQNFEQELQDGKSSITIRNENAIALYKKVTDDLQILTFILDNNHKIIFINKAFIEHLGISYNVTENKIKKIIHEEDWNLWNENFFKLSNFKDDRYCIFKIRFLVKSEPKHLQVKARVLNEPAAEIPPLYYFVAEEIKPETNNENNDYSLNDKSERYSDLPQKSMLEKQLERTVKDLNKSNKELEEFAYAASHDLQEPLRKITTYSTRLATRFSQTLGDDGRFYIERINVAAQAMRELIDNLLEISRTAQNTHPFVSTDLNEIIRRAEENLEFKIEESKARIIKDKLPVIDALPSLMLQLFDNLLSNAIKFRVTGRAPEISITSKEISREESEKLLLPQNTYYQIQVQDNGIGFDQQSAKNIFLIFHRLHGKKDYSGSGIGLAICKKIVEKHNGLIWAKSATDKGSSFYIILPKTSKKQ